MKNLFFVLLLSLLLLPSVSFGQEVSVPDMQNVQPQDNLPQEAQEQISGGNEQQADESIPEEYDNSGGESEQTSLQSEDSDKTENLEFKDFPKELNLAQDFTLYLTLPERAEVDEENLNQKDFEILSLKTDESGLTAEIKAVAFALGKVNFDSVIFKSASGKIYKTLPVQTEVKPVDTGFKDKKLLDIRQPYRPFNYWILFWIILAVVLLYAVYRILKKKAQVLGVKKLKELEKDDRPIDVIALDRIDHLLLGGLWQQGSYKYFYSTFIDILKDYISERFTMDAHQCTSKDLVRALKKNPDFKGNLTQLADLQRSADYVKFAKVEPTEAQRDEDIRNLRNIIIDTRPPKVSTLSDNKEKELL